MLVKQTQAFPAVVVVFVVGLAVTSGKICYFPETVPVVQSDGSEKCVCDTSRGYCGLREDLCVKNVCDDNRILLHDCLCVCPTNYTETTEGNCIAVQTPKCKDGKIILLNEQCGLPSTADTNNTKTTSPPVPQINPPEVKATNITSTSAILLINVIRPQSMMGYIAARIYGPRNESLLRQQERDIDPDRNITDMKLPNLSPNTTYTVAVRVFLQNARATDAKVLQIRTISEISEQEGPTTGPYLPSDNTDVLKILIPIVSIMVVALVLIVFFCGCGNTITFRCQRLQQRFLNTRRNTPIQAVPVVTGRPGSPVSLTGENIPLRGQRNGDVVPNVIDEDENARLVNSRDNERDHREVSPSADSVTESVEVGIAHSVEPPVDDTDVIVFEEQDNTLPNYHIYPILSQTSYKSMAGSDDDPEDTKLMKLVSEPPSSGMVGRDDEQEDTKPTKLVNGYLAGGMIESDNGQENTKLMKLVNEHPSSATEAAERLCFQPNTIDGNGKQVISNQINSIGPLTDESQQDDSRVIDNQNDSHVPLTEQFQHGLNNRTQLHDNPSIHSIQQFGGTQPSSNTS
ncbi:uncharacterized protein LOC117345071 [Pecten maximus]|uniref:uncharacterized protein LOC117345071 n=1 Tax=Pecten maximus TaxID=6579 RepID=UPI0014580D22|nr:uncharacterized protein LOC117345071 [Pecten maximus]